MRAAVLALGVLVLTPMAAHAGPFEDAVLSRINEIRAHPAAYAEALARAEEDDEDADEPLARREAVAFLQHQAPLPPLRADERVAAAALAHAQRQADSGEVGHGAPGSLGQRLQSQGIAFGAAGETISYGESTPEAVIRQLVVDAGIPDRGHRKVLFAESFQLAGVSCGAHAVYRQMCVIDFAGGLRR